MASQKPTQPPAFDAAVTWAVLRSELRQGDPFVMVEGVRIPVQQDGAPYQVFGDAALPRWKRWIDGTAEYDTKGLRDVVNANAIYLDEVKDGLDAHKAADAARHSTLNQRLAALEAAQAQPSPFPGDSS